MIDDADVLYGEALERFRSLFERAGETGLKEPTAMNLATVDAQGRPSSRMVLLKHFDEHGFVFYTNRNSRKGRQLGGNPNAALCFFWDPLMEQVRIEGATVTVTNEEADDYWKTRSRNSQLGAWASFQSEPLDSRDTLEARFAQMRERFAEQPIPRPPHWSGYRMVPELIEFWVGVEFRLHERTCYRKAGRAWTVSLLNP
ncbi:MAG: pyridoxamine 5'-phosphate oxidase [Gammaproteobacteria bacterium]|nr:pyridoxamine 5'-phosphate oxidase [Gammaproteobacteria bacterium]